MKKILLVLAALAALATLAPLAHAGKKVIVVNGGEAPVDTIPPLAPTGLTAVAGYDSVLLYWTPPEGARTYTLYKAEGGEDLAVLASGFGTTGYVDYAVSEETTYFYAVSATDRAGEGPQSAAIEVTTLSNTTPALPPPIVDGVSFDGVVLLSWDAIDGASSYRIYRRTNYEQLALIASPAGSLQGYADYNVLNGQSYYYAMSTVNSIGVEGARGPEIQVTATVYEAPEIYMFNLYGLSLSRDGLAQLEVNWEANKDVNYKYVYWADNDPEPNQAVFPYQPYAASVANELVDTSIPWPTADADSTVRITWEEGTPAPDHYALDGRYNDGDWQRISDSIPADSLGYTHTAADVPPVRRGKWEYRMYAVGALGDMSDVATPDGALFNDAIQVKSRLYVNDGTSGDYSQIASVIEINQPESGGDVDYPDTTGTFGYAGFDTSKGVVDTYMSIEAAEPIRLFSQAKVGAGEIWAPSVPTLQPASLADSVFAKASTYYQTKYADGDTIYMRYKLVDAASNQAPWVGPIRKIFNRAVPPPPSAGGDTVLFAFSDESAIGSFTPSGDRYVWNVLGLGISRNVPEAYSVTGDVNYSMLKADYPDTAGTNPASIRTVAAVGGHDHIWPLTGTESDMLLYFSGVADSLAGMTIIEAQLLVVSTAAQVEAGNTLRAYGINTAAMAAWTGQNDASYNYYDSSEQLPWSPALDSYPSPSDFSAGFGDSTMTESSVPAAAIGLDATAAAQAWADGDPCGGFLITVINNSPMFTETADIMHHSNTNTSRPMLWVLGVR